MIIIVYITNLIENQSKIKGKNDKMLSQFLNHSFILR